MNYCSLSDAFPVTDGTPSPECGDTISTKEARKEERRKIRRTKRVLEPSLMTDPDRQNIKRLPEVLPMESFVENSVPISNPEVELEYYKQDGSNNSILKQSATDRVGGNINVIPRKRFFGVDPDDEPFADYTPDLNSYTLEPNFTTAFSAKGIDRATGGSKIAIPSISDAWKPLTPSGANTSFFKNLPLSGNTSDISSLEKKIDMLFARLDDLQNGGVENAQTEVMMFISTGIFVMFLMDLLVKRGMSVKI